MFLSQKIVLLCVVCALPGCGTDALYPIQDRQEADPIQPPPRVVVVPSSEVLPMQQWIGDISFPDLPALAQVGPPVNFILTQDEEVVEEPETETTTIIIVVNTEEEAEELLPEVPEPTYPIEPTSPDPPTCTEPDLDFDLTIHPDSFINPGEEVILSESVVARCGTMRLTSILWGLMPAADDTVGTWNEGQVNVTATPRLPLNVFPGEDLQAIEPIFNAGTPEGTPDRVMWAWQSHERDEDGYDINMSEIALPEDQWTLLSLALDTSFLAPGSVFRPFLLMRFVRPDGVPISTLSYFQRYTIRMGEWSTAPVSLTMGSFAIACEDICALEPMHFELRVEEGHPSDYVQSCTLTHYATAAPETLDGPRALDAYGRFLTVPLEVDPTEGRWFSFLCEQRIDAIIEHDIIVRTYLLQDPSDSSLDVLMGITTILAP